VPTALPVIRGTSTALYPFTQTFICQTGVSDSQSANPTRWVKGPPLVKFEFPYNPLNKTEKDALKTALTSAKGEYDDSLSATLGATEYDYLTFDNDEFSASEPHSTIYGVKWTLMQTLPQNWSPGAWGGAFPTLANGLRGQLPYTQRKRFQTITAKVEAGPHYPYAEFGGGLTGFPSDGLMAWEFGNPVLSDADANTLIAHFLANWGNCFPFQFTDSQEDGVTYSNVYYASPQLVVTRVNVNHTSVGVSLVQMN